MSTPTPQPQIDTPSELSCYLTTWLLPSSGSRTVSTDPDDCTVSAADFDRYYLALLALTTAIESRLTITQRDQLEPELSAAKNLYSPVANPERGNATGQG